VNDENVALLTDLYELTMVRAYLAEGVTSEAVFDLFVRRLPEQRNYLLACGLDDVLHYLTSFGFSDEALDYLETLDTFPHDFLDQLSEFKFTGDVWAVPEGTPVFPDEPILQIVAPIAEAQLVESFVLNQVSFQTLAASKASRVVRAAGGRDVVDFGLRRMQGADAGVKAARAFWVAGVAATSNVLAGQVYGVPVAGTMAHSYIEAHDDEYEAFKAFACIYPETILLVDTYDTIEGVMDVVRLAGELGDDFRVRAIRLDSGDLASLARKARTVLDSAGLGRVQIFASGSLDEYTIAELLSARAPIDGFGVGTRMGVSEDAPSLDSVYKLVGYEGRDRMKLSPGKTTLPGRKQTFRVEEDGVAARDVIGLPDEDVRGRPLLVRVMREGRRVSAVDDDLPAARERARRELARLPDRLLGLEVADPPYEVGLSPGLERKRDDLRRDLEARRREG
jgi:nicotinate phosphoribosyltransferase